MLVKQSVFYLLFSTIVVGTIPNLLWTKRCFSSLDGVDEPIPNDVRYQNVPPLDPPLDVLSSQPQQHTLDTQIPMAKTPALFMERKQDYNTSQREENHNRSCVGYQGILLITEILPMAGTGTVFFQSILSSLLYAKRYNLYPWIHVNTTVNTVVYDPKVHGPSIRENSTSLWLTFSHLTGNIPDLMGEGRMKCTTTLGTRPGPPDYSMLELKNYTLVGNGLWDSYFEPLLPISRLLLQQGACSAIPIFHMSFRQATTGMSKCSDIAVRAWPYLGTPEALMPSKGQSMHDWLGANRKRATPIIQEYYRPLPWLKELIHQANPVTDRKCLSIHVRLTDKANGRDKKGVGSYLPYAETFVNMTQYKYPIYLATDDATVVTKFRQSFSPAGQVWIQENAIRSTSTTPTFELLKHDIHRSNTEALVDIYAMAKCAYFVHGYSGMAEAVVYIAPELHEQSMNLDDPLQKTLRKSLKAFRGLLQARQV